MSLTQERLKEVLEYNPETGLFVWLCDMYRRKLKGKVAGGKVNNCYLRVKVDGVSYTYHRLAFLYMEGKFPVNMVDHINQNKVDNRWVNLRHADARLNSSNRINNNPVIGVNKTHNKWLARSRTINGKRKKLGYFKYYLQACAARFEYDSLHEEVLLWEV